MKKTYEAPTLEISLFETEDVLLGESGVVVKVNLNLDGGKDMEELNIF